MRTSLLLIGHYRTFRANIDSIKKYIVNIYHPDIYVLIYNKVDCENATWYKAAESSDNITEDDITLIRTLNPVYLNIIDESEIVHDDKYKNKFCANLPVYVIFNQLYLLKIIFDHIKDNNIQYDLFIKLRPDIRLCDHIPFEFSQNMFHSYDLLTAYQLSKRDRNFKSSTDILYLFNNKMVENIDTIIENMMIIVNINCNDCPENIFIKGLLLSNIKIGYLHYMFPRNCKIIRLVRK